MSLNRTWPFVVTGLVLSSYALYVEHKVAHKSEEEEDFTALCDIEQIGASCSGVFQLPEGRLLSYFGIVPNDHILDIPNAGLGFMYYSFWLLLLDRFPRHLSLIISTLALSSTVFLAIKLLILEELCVLCWSTHIINSRLWWNCFYTTVLATQKRGRYNINKKLE